MVKIHLLVKPRKIVILGIGLLILAGGIFGKMYLASLKTAPKKKPARESFTKVPVVPVRYQDQETELSYYGRVGTYQAVALISEVQGLIKAGSVALKPGKRVSKGQLLFRIDSREAQLTLQSQKSQFMKSIADILADIQVDYPNRFPTWQAYFESLDVEKSLPKLPVIEDLKEKTFISTRGILSSYYSILSQEERLRKYKVYAPFSGSISEVSLEPGSVANPGVKIATLTKTSQLELVLPVRSDDLSWLTEGTTVEVFSEDRSQSWKGKIARIGEQVDPLTQSVNVYVSLKAGGKNSIIDGQYLQATLPGKVVQKAMVIPRQALFETDHVYLVVDDKLQKTQVKVHKLDPTEAIVSGMEAGAQLVREIPLNAVDQLPVKVIAQ